MITTVDNMEKLVTGEVHIQSLLNKANSYIATNKDYVLPLSDLQIDKEAHFYLDNQPYHITEYAFGQLCQKLGVPVTYIKKCYDTNKSDLALQNLREWLHDDSRTVLLRTYGDTVRGILSDKYSILDTPDVLLSLQSAVPRLDDYVIENSYLSNDRLHLRVVGRNKLDIPGEDLYAGFQLDTSDVGKSSLVVKFLIYKKVCTNGLILPKQTGELFRQKHIGINNESFKSQLAESFDNLSDLIHYTCKVIEDTRANSVNMIQLEKLLSRIQIETRLGESSIDSLRELINEKYDTTLWGMINAITEEAQKFSLDRRLELERYASKFLIA